MNLMLVQTCLRFQYTNYCIITCYFNHRFCGCKVDIKCNPVLVNFSGHILLYAIYMVITSPFFIKMHAFEALMQFFRDKRVTGEYDLSHKIKPLPSNIEPETVWWQANDKPIQLRINLLAKTIKWLFPSHYILQQK